jgi:hypothetical protein
MKPELEEYLKSAQTGTDLSIYDILNKYFDNDYLSKSNIDKLHYGGGIYLDYYNNINTFFDDIFVFLKSISTSDITFKTRPNIFYNLLTGIMTQFYRLDINMNNTRAYLNRKVNTQKVDELTLKSLKSLNELESFSDKEFLRKKCKDLINILIFVCDNPIKKELTKYNSEMIKYTIYPYCEVYNEGLAANDLV